MADPFLTNSSGEISASPNPLPADVDVPVTVTWSSDVPDASVCVSYDGGAETLVASQPEGSVEIGWIQAGRVYAFRLRGSAPENPVLSEVEVTRAIEGKIFVIRDGPAGADQQLVVRWEVTSPANAEVTLSENGSEERLVCQGPSGDFVIHGIKPTIENVFRLYSSGRRRRLLDQTAFSRPPEGWLTASPNPVTLTAGSKTTLQWESNCPDGVEVCLSENGGPEAVVCRGKSGTHEILGLCAGTEYHFRLYPIADNRPLLDQTKVTVDPIPWSGLLDRILRARDGVDFTPELAEFVGVLLSRCIRRPEYPQWFRLWEENNVHVTPVHYYEPLPDTRTLKDSLWAEAGTLPGVDMNGASQERLLREVFPRFQNEYDTIPLTPIPGRNDFHLHNGRFEGIDAMVAYCMVRHFQPRQILEIGAGFSTLIMAQAAVRNGSTELHSIEPYPESFLSGHIPGLTSLQATRVEELDEGHFSCLKTGDFLFIDTSHVVRIGGDVNFLFLKILPRLAPGVIVHVHDIFLPFEYPQDWLLEKHRFWTEQYLLQAFLIHNAEFEVLVSSGYLSHHFREEVKTIFPTAAPWGGGSFWMKKKDAI